jgi:hypothetical protein
MFQYRDDNVMIIQLHTKLLSFTDIKVAYLSLIEQHHNVKHAYKCVTKSTVRGKGTHTSPKYFDRK